MIDGRLTDGVRAEITELAIDLAHLSLGDKQLHAYIIGSIVIGGMHLTQTEKILIKLGVPEPFNKAGELNRKGRMVWAKIRLLPIPIPGEAPGVAHFIAEMNKEIKKMGEETT